MTRHWTADAGLLREELTREWARLELWGLSGPRFARLLRLTRHLARLVHRPYSAVEKELERDGRHLAEEGGPD